MDKRYVSDFAMFPVQVAASKVEDVALFKLRFARFATEI